MEHALGWPLESWEPFFVIIGTSASALTGLQFVVITLGSETKALNGGTASAFGTPTVVHFCSVLFLCAMLSAPWGGTLAPAIALGGLGIAGAIYSMIVVRRATRQDHYRPVLEDWLFHTVFPLISYIALTAAAVLLVRDSARSLFVAAAAIVALLFIGIHNAWDAVVYLALGERERS